MTNTMLRITQTACFLCGFIIAFEIIPERPELLQVNEKYLKWVNFTVKHYGRHIPYMMNVEVETRVTFSNDLMIECILYELLSNTYRPTMVQIRMKVCNFLKNEPYVGRMFTQKMNVSCPLTPKVYRFNNMTLLQFENFPYKLPLTWASEVTKARVDVRFYFPQTNEVVGMGRIHITLKQK